MEKDDDFTDWLIAREECIMDLDDEELKATRKLNGVAKEENEKAILRDAKKNLLDKNDTEAAKIIVEKCLLGNWVIVGGRTNYIKLALKTLLEEREADKKKIQELELKQKEMCEEYCPKTERIKELEVLEDDLKDKRVVYIDTPEFAENYIPKQKVKDLLIEIQKEYEKLDKASDEFLRNKEKTVEDYVLEKERLTTMQTLAYCRDNLEELSEDK